MPKSSIECAGSNVTGPRYAFNPLRSGTLLVIAVMIALGFLMILRPMVRDGAPGDYETRRGDILLTDGAYGAAIAEFDRALTVSPAHRGAIMGRAIALMESGQSSAAEEEFGRLIRLLGTSARDDPTGMATLAAAYANRGFCGTGTDEWTTLSPIIAAPWGWTRGPLQVQGWSTGSCTGLPRPRRWRRGLLTWKNNWPFHPNNSASTFPSETPGSGCISHRGREF